MLLYLLGAAMAGSFGFMIVWADFEASLFDASLSAEERLTTLRCSPILTEEGEGTIRAAFTNPTEQPLRRRVNVHVTDGFITLMREIEENVILQPGETRQLIWSVTPSDVVWGRFVLARLYVNRIYPLPSLTGACGVVYAGITGVTGDQLTWLIVVGSLLAMGSGLWLWIQPNRPLYGRIRTRTYVLSIVAGLLLLVLVTGLMGWWIVAGALLVITVLILVVLFTLSLEVR
jgi:hypothetical protein